MSKEEPLSSDPTVPRSGEAPSIDPKLPRTVDTANKFIVGLQGDSVVLMRPPGPRLTPDDALLLAAYLVALAEHKATHSFKDVLDAVVGA